jgi:hypothetical protein
MDFLDKGFFEYSHYAKTLPQLLSLSWAQSAGAVFHLPLIAVVWVLISTMQRWQTARVSASAGAVT